MPADARVYLDDAGQHRWRLIDANGHVLISDPYPSETAALEALEDTRTAFVQLDEQEPEQG